MRHHEKPSSKNLADSESDYLQTANLLILPLSSNYEFSILRIQLSKADEDMFWYLADTGFSRNYLQSPYFFMVCNLCDADLSRPGQLAAAPLGENKDKQSESSLAGTLVSSLHRLKDVDNSGTSDVHYILF